MEVGVHYGRISGSDCGWVDKVEWSGSAPEVTPPAPPSTWTEVGYTYDPAGRRIEKKYDGTTVVKYLYDGDHCLAEYDGNNNLLRKYIYGPAVDEPISMIDVELASATYYYHFDGLGSVIALSDADGTTAVLYEYSVYGQVAASDPNHPNRFLFTGREFDKETGLYYYRARYYNPEIGRFLQTDSVGYGAGMNLYRYCLNNPLNWIDPFGFDPCDPCEPRQAGAWGWIRERAQRMWELIKIVTRRGEGDAAKGILRGVPTVKAYAEAVEGIAEEGMDYAGSEDYETLRSIPERISTPHDPFKGDECACEHCREQREGAGAPPDGGGSSIDSPGTTTGYPAGYDSDLARAIRNGTYHPGVYSGMSPPSDPNDDYRPNPYAGTEWDPYTGEPAQRERARGNPVPSGPGYPA